MNLLPIIKNIKNNELLSIIKNIRYNELPSKI